MKNYKVVLLAFISTLIFSCEDAIDIVQPGELYPEVAFQTVDDLEKGINGVYGVGGENTEIAFASIFTDEVRIGLANGGQGLINDAEYSFRLNTGSGYAVALWGQYYSMINFATRVIEGAKNVVPETSEEAQYKNIIAQAHILRAYAHFKLLTYFSADITDDNALGVILLDFIPLTNQSLPRNTNAEIFALINSDLAKVSDLTTNAGNADRFFISNDFVKALKARMALYREDYTTAAALATELIAQYPLTNRAQYPNIWRDLPVAAPATDEVIFKWDRVADDEIVGANWASVNATVTGSPFFEVSTDLRALLSTVDVRRSVIVDASANATVFPVGKYPGSGGLRINDIKVFRTSEMYFIRAEAKANASDFEGVAADLQAVVAQRFSAANTPTIGIPATQQAAWAEILKQRRVELAFEGHRYIDLRRVGPKAGVDIIRDPADCAVNGACTLSSSDYRFVMPIPSSEIGANPAIAPQQNPGYGTIN
ncbi:RagB/SusD family nutrient uptake outer membrane protein [Flavobacterium tegetincola]|uniref:RagB/SusD family nutrient uptake outer membrane protein n=1 Tax=Flavobacterium tegetincola TaxID=150172 RepID=UPI0003FC4846|nr:RagB/SusD family nutrient uptake outer membrane protein [Flavobacterium tegetincola]